MDMKSEGVSLRPLWTMAKWRHNEMFLDNVRVPKTALVGELHQGWYQVATALDFERSNFAAYGTLRRQFEEIVHYSKIHWRDGQPLSKDPLVRAKLAQVGIDIAAGLRFSLRVASMQARGLVPNYEASVNKIWSSELQQRLGQIGYETLGLYGGVGEGSPYAEANGLWAHQTLNWPGRDRRRRLQRDPAQRRRATGPRHAQGLAPANSSLPLDGGGLRGVNVTLLRARGSATKERCTPCLSETRSAARPSPTKK